MQKQRKVTRVFYAFTIWSRASLGDVTFSSKSSPLELPSIKKLDTEKVQNWPVEAFMIIRTFYPHSVSSISFHVRIASREFHSVRWILFVMIDPGGSSGQILVQSILVSKRSLTANLFRS
jgi:hypothetical protein